MCVCICCVPSSNIAIYVLLELSMCSSPGDEVQEMLTGLCGLVKADVGSDLINSSHTNALLLRQLFQRAEKWHLKLQANVSEIEDK